MSYECEYFVIQELVPRHVYEDRGQKAWQLLDVSMLIGMDQMRDEHGRIIVNNWHVGGNREWSGLRTPGCPFYSEYSQHPKGRATDSLFLDKEVSIVRDDILEHPGKFGICAVELNVIWLHADWRNCTPTMTFTQ